MVLQGFKGSFGSTFSLGKIEKDVLIFMYFTHLFSSLLSPQVWNSSRFGVPSSSGGMQFGYQVVAVCEMISLPQYQKLIDAKEHSAYYVIESEKHVRVRALLLFQDPMHSSKHNNQICQSSPPRKASKAARPSVLQTFSGLQIAFLLMKLSTILTLGLMILWMCKGRSAVYSQ